MFNEMRAHNLTKWSGHIKMIISLRSFSRFIRHNNNKKKNAKKKQIQTKCPFFSNDLVKNVAVHLDNMKMVHSR